jgi:hypothetical protein
MNINWAPPQLRKGWRGYWDAFVGPGATSAEEWLQLLGGLVLSTIALLVFFLRFPGQPTLAQIVVLSLLALDLSGGIITNATSTAKRWYHREGQGSWQLLVFILPHGIHLALLVWLFPGFAWWFFLLFYGYLVASALLILHTPLYLQRPMAFICYAGVVLLSSLSAPTPGLEWVVPFLFLKLLISHLLKEAPFRPAQEHLP